MATPVGSLFVDLSVNSAAFVSDLGRAQRALSTNSARMNRTLGALTRHFNMSAASVAGLGVAAAAAAAGGLFVMTKSAVQMANQIAVAADKIGLGTEALQELGFAAEQADVNTRTFEMGMQRFSRRVGEAAQNKGELRDTLKQYNIAVTDAQGRTRALEDILGDYAEAIRGAGSSQEQLRLAFKAFDSEGAVLVNLMRRGRAGIADLRAEARRLGIVINDDMVRSAERANDELRKLERVLSVNMSKAVLNLAPLLETISTSMLDLSGKVRDFFAQFKEESDLSVEEIQGRIEIVKKTIQNFESSLAHAENMNKQYDWLVPDEVIEKTKQSIRDAEEELVRLQLKLEELRRGGRGRGMAGDGVGADAFEGVAQKIRERAQALGEEAAQLRMTSSEWARYTAFQEAVAFAKENNIALSDDQVRALLAEADAVQRQAEALDEAKKRHEKLDDQVRLNEDSYRSMARASSDFLRDVTVAADSARESVARLADSLLQAFLQAKLFGPLEGTLSNLFTAGTTGGGSSFAGQPTPPTLIKAQRGTDFVVDGRGGTDANLIPLAVSKGERVTVQTADQQRAGRGQVTQFFVDMRGASAEAVQRLERLVDQLNAELEPRAVAATANAVRRGAL